MKLIFKSEIFISKNAYFQCKGSEKTFQNYIEQKIFLSPLENLKIVEIEDIHKNDKIYTPPPWLIFIKMKTIVFHEQIRKKREKNSKIKIKYLKNIK